MTKGNLSLFHLVFPGDSLSLREVRAEPQTEQEPRGRS